MFDNFNTHELETTLELLIDEFNHTKDQKTLGKINAIMDELHDRRTVQ